MCSFLADSSSGHVYFDLIDIENAFAQLDLDQSVEKTVRSFDLHQWAQCLAAISPSNSNPYASFLLMQPDQRIRIIKLDP